jgi:translation initiation factor IF-2
VSSLYVHSVIFLDEIGRRIALGQFKELNVLKGDVDGSVEALSDSFSKLSTEEIQIIHKGVGAITETDVMLASASDAIIGFNVRPAGNARTIGR